MKTIENKGFLPSLNAMGWSVPVKTTTAFQIPNKINGFEHVSYGMALSCIQFSSYNKTALERCQASPTTASPTKPPRFFLAKTMRACYPAWKRNAVRKASALRIPAKEDKFQTIKTAIASTIQNAGFEDAGALYLPGNRHGKKMQNAECQATPERFAQASRMKKTENRWQKAEF